MLSRPQNPLSSPSIIKASDRIKMNLESKDQQMLEGFNIKKSILLQNKIVLFHPFSSWAIFDLETLTCTLCDPSKDSILRQDVDTCSVCLNRENQIVLFGKTWPRNGDSLRSALEILSLTDSNGK